jgi:PAS domain S-box-containing protein
MKLSAKIVLVIISTFIALVFVVSVASDIILLHGFAKLEATVLKEDVQKIRNEIDESIPELEASARNYVELLHKYSPHHIAVLGVSSFVNNRVDFAISYSASGELIAARAADFHNRKITSVSDELLQSAVPAAVRALKLNEGRLQGFMAVGRQVCQIVVRPLENGSVVLVGKYLDTEEIGRISKLTKLDLDLRPVAIEDQPADFMKVRPALERTPEFASLVLGNSHIAGYSMFADIYGHPALSMKVTKQRILYEHGKMTIVYVLISLCICGAVFCGVMLMFIRGAVLKRIASLSATVKEISDKGDISARLDVNGKDELSTMADSINMMLASLESAETALKESEGRYRTLFERAPDSIFIIGTEGDDAGRILDANLAASAQHGYSSQELCSMHIRDLNTPETNAFAKDLMDKIMAEEWVAHEVWHARKDGSRFPIEVHAGKIRLGGHDYILGFDRDITSRKLAEESDRLHLEHIRQLNSDLAIQAKEREAANRELETFNYSVSHDLRGPLTRISGYCQLVLDDEDGMKPHLRTYVSRIYESSCWLDEMIDAMLNLSRLSRMDYNPVPVNISLCVEEILREHTLAESERSVESIVTRDVMATGDAGLIKILLGNLIGNAWKYSAGSETARIEFGLLSDGQVPVYFVRDNGVGFDMKDADKLFRVFTRLHDNSRFSGSGIGLAIAQRIIARHGGRIWAEGEPGAGATFFFTLVSEGDDAAPVLN